MIQSCMSLLVGSGDMPVTRLNRMGLGDVAEAGEPYLKRSHRA